jgi:hypothetical protein
MNLKGILMKNGYNQVIDNLVYQATKIILLTLHTTPTKCNMSDIITSVVKSNEWLLLDEVVYVCSVTYNIPINQIIFDYTLKLTNVIKQKLKTTI